jgi:hypothetical protein
MPDYMRYSGEAVEIFATTPSGQRVPRLRSHVIGERVGDHAFVDDRAMYWDGDVWQPLSWKDFAVWKKAEVAPRRRVSDIDDLQIELIEVLSRDGEIDLVDLTTDRVRELRDAQ